MSDKENSKKSINVKELKNLSLAQITRELDLRSKVLYDKSGPSSEISRNLKSLTLNKAESGTSLTSEQLHGEKKSRQKVIYGVDNRLDYYQLDDDKKKECDSVLSLFNNGDIIDDGSGKSRLRTGKFGDAFNLCEGELFSKQPNGAFCSGFLIADDLVATAGHCVSEEDISDVSFVFGYRMKGEEDPQNIIDSSEIYRAKEIVGRKLTDDGTDWCVVRLDRPVKNHEHFKIRRSGKIGDSQGVYVIGHPCGIPIKYAAGAWVRKNSNEAFFVANLDTYGGNSGSPVFNSDTGEVEGILVRGETDFDNVGNCNRSNVCPDTGCRGEDITRVSEFVNLLPEE